MTTAPIRRLLFTAALGCCLAPSSLPAQAGLANRSDYTKNVDPFIGVDWGGNTFIGAAVPFGTVKLGPDVEDFDGIPSKFGYMSTGRILGFSHLHLSGAAGKYGNILVTPLTGFAHPEDIRSARSHEVNRPGYYAASLTRYGVRAELTSTRRVGFHRYTYTAGNNADLAVNIDHCLTRGANWEAQHFLGGELHFVSKSELTGVGRYTGGWNQGGEYRVYFDMQLDAQAESTKIWQDKTIADAKDVVLDADRSFGAVFHFGSKAGKAIQAKVAISFVGIEQARETIRQEAPGWNFEEVRANSVRQWNHELARIRVQGETPEQRVQLYTALYHTMLMPSDRTGENPAWKSSEPYYDDYYAIWDTYRSSGPLFTLIAPERQRDMLRSLVDIYRHTGYMPDARSGNANGRTQGGSNANILIADALVKGMKGIDYETAFQAMLKDANVAPPDPTKEGRGGLDEYNSKGYISLANERSGSRTVEYAYDDFAIAEVACGLHRPGQARLYAERSRNWSNLWDKDLTLEGFKGFLRPRNPDGSWAQPFLRIDGSWHDFFYEGDLWTYSFYAPHDTRRAIELAGGEKEFTRRLDYIFRKKFDVTNEPGFLMPVLYNWAGRPDKSAEIVTLLLDKYFTGRRSGIPGNDDSGAMSSWYIFQALGFYPNAGQDTYLIGTPSFPVAELQLGGGKTLRIEARNLDNQHMNRYIQSAVLNGKPLETSWFRHNQIANGGTLVFVLGAEPADWGKKLPPPSFTGPGSSFCTSPAD
jgi:predicted alpha-1,2-mannosidase